MSPAVCTICGAPVRLAAPDADVVCVPCFTDNLAGEGRREVPEAPPTLTLTPRDVQALVRYRIHRQAVLGTGPCRPLVREED